MKNKIYEKAVHPFKPVYNENSRILLLGTFPSPASRKDGFYYGHPKNLFWTVLSSVFSGPLPVTIDEKRHFLFEHGIALWDVLFSCEISGAADSSIRNAKANDFTPLINAGIRRIYTAGRKAEQLYKLHSFKNTGIEAVYLPSTSPANRHKWSLSKLIEAYRVLAE